MVAASDSLNPQQFPVEELMHYANPDRVSDHRNKRQVDNLAQSLSTYGYHRSRGPAYMAREHGNPWPHQNIELVHLDDGSYLNNGNHRVHAAAQVGMPTLPAVVKDLRSPANRMSPVRPLPSLG